MAKKANGSLRLYKSYNFRDKDPVIDLLRTAKDDQKLKLSKLAVDSGVSATTMHNWFFGKTKRPQFCTVVAVARVIGGQTIGRVHTLIRTGK